ncbi:hypothetical protein KM043_013379 [Ampulex compressa]|nr:hypothetical protein KM043_013379 [Ampulex compressa]
MALSKPTQVVYKLLALYLERLYESPLKTKAITSCLVATLGNFVSQKLSRRKYINEDSLVAFALFGLLFGGTIPHYFYTYIHHITRSPLNVLLIERCLYTPCLQAFALFMLALFEGNSPKEASKQTRKLYLPVLLANLRYLTILQYINFKFVPPMLRVLMLNLINFIWFIYLTQRRANSSKIELIDK